MMSSAARREGAGHLIREYEVSQHCACAVLQTPPRKSSLPNYAKLEFC